MGDDDDLAAASAGYGPGKEYVSKGFIVLFGGLLGIFIIALLVTLKVQWPSCELKANAGPPPCTQASKSATQPPAAPPPVPGSITLASMQPATGPVGGCESVTLIGSGFSDGAKVLFGGTTAPSVSVNSATMITASAPPHAKGKVDVTVVQGSQGLNATLSAGYAYACPVPDSGNLLIMIVLAGALGGALHGLQSFVIYVGSRKLLWSWMPNYLLLPIAGAALAVIFYIIVGAGLMASVGTDPGFGIIGLGALVGMFSQPATEKLKTIAEGILAKAPKSSDRVEQKPPKPPDPPHPPDGDATAKKDGVLETADVR